MNTKKDIRTTRKKIIATLVGLVLTTIAFIGGTVAYFTDTVETTNVIKSGSIKITQTETDRNGNPFAGIVRFGKNFLRKASKEYRQFIYKIKKI